MNMYRVATRGRMKILFFIRLFYFIGNSYKVKKMLRGILFLRDPKSCVGVFLSDIWMCFSKIGVCRDNLSYTPVVFLGCVDFYANNRIRRGWEEQFFATPGIDIKWRVYEIERKYTPI